MMLVAARVLGLVDGVTSHGGLQLLSCCARQREFRTLRVEVKKYRWVPLGGFGPAAACFHRPANQVETPSPYRLSSDWEFAAQAIRRPG